MTKALSLLLVCGFFGCATSYDVEDAQARMREERAVALAEAKRDLRDAIALVERTASLHELRLTKAEQSLGTAETSLDALRRSVAESQVLTRRLGGLGERVAKTESSTRGLARDVARIEKRLRGKPAPPAPSTDLAKRVKVVEDGVSRLQRTLRGHATKKSLEDYATKDSLKAHASKADLHEVAARIPTDAVGKLQVQRIVRDAELDGSGGEWYGPAAFALVIMAMVVISSRW